MLFLTALHGFYSMLDEDTQYDTTQIAKDMLWDERISKWFNNWETVFEPERVMGELDGLIKIKQFIKQSKFATKKNILEYMNWGVQIKWTPYRNALRLCTNIKLTKNGYEWID